jgi:integrase
VLVPAVIALFLAWCERHRSEPTAKFYRSNLRRFRDKFPARHFASRVPEAPVQTGFTPLDIDEYLDDAGKGLSDTTRRHQAVALETLQKFSIEQKLMPGRIFEKLEKPPMGHRDEILSDDHVKRLLKNAPPAFRLIFTALLQTGCRPAELCRLTIPDVLKAPGRFVDVIELKIHKTARKTGKPRLVPIGKKFARLLWLAIGERREGPVFRNARGRAWTPDTLGKACRRIREREGLPRSVIVYLARHTNATLQLESGQDIKTVADLLGHSSTKTTEKYIHRDMRQLRGDQDRI